MRRPRASFMLVLSVISLLTLTGRLFHLQILRYRHYAEKARKKCLLLEVVTPRRGSITDRNRLPIAYDATTYDLAVVPARFDRLLRLVLRLRAIGVPNPEKVFSLTAQTNRVVVLCPISERRLPYILRAPLSDGSLFTLQRGKTVLLAATPELLSETRKMLVVVAELTGQNPKKLMSRYTKIRQKIITCKNGYERRHLMGSPYVLAERIGRFVAMRVEAEGWRLPGVCVVERKRRRYAGEAFGTLTGYLRLINADEAKELRAQGRIISRGYNSPSTYERIASADCYFWDERVGAFRLEAALERRLRGRKGVRLLERDIEEGGYCVLSEVKAKAGENVRLNIDADLQKVAYEALKKRGFRGAVVLVDPNSGAILAMASYPSFDPAKIKAPKYYKEIMKRGGLIERCGGACYPPGSTVKPLVAAAALAEHIITPQTTVTCRGYYRSRKAFRCWIYPNAHGPLNVTSAIERSCNVFFFEVAERLGGEKLAKWLARFGLGEKPADIPWSKRGFLPSPSNTHPWYRGYGRLVAIGQGQLLASPLQIARAMCAIATGKLPLLRLFDETPPQSRPLGIPESVLDVVRDGMRLVVESRHGTAHKTGLSAFYAAAKTGTAEVSKKRHLNHAWIAGFAPYDAPKVVFVVLVEKVRGHGGQVAGPVAEEVLKAFFGERKRAER